MSDDKPGEGEHAPTGVAATGGDREPPKARQKKTLVGVAPPPPGEDRAVAPADAGIDARIDARIDAAVVATPDLTDDEPTTLADPLLGEPVPPAPVEAVERPAKRRAGSGTFRPPAPGHNEVVLRRRSSRPAKGGSVPPVAPIPSAGVPVEATRVADPRPAHATPFPEELSVDFDPSAITEPDVSVEVDVQDEQPPVELDPEGRERSPGAVPTDGDADRFVPDSVPPPSYATEGAVAPKMARDRPQALESTQIDRSLARRGLSPIVILSVACSVAAVAGVAAYFALGRSSGEAMADSSDDVNATPVGPLAPEPGGATDPTGVSDPVGAEPVGDDSAEPGSDPAPGQGDDGPNDPSSDPAGPDEGGEDPTGYQPGAGRPSPRMEIPEHIAAMPRLVRLQRAQELRLRARNLHVQRAFARADAVWQLALQHEPDHPHSVYGYARTLRSLDRNGDAMPWAEYAVELDPTDWRHRELLGDLLRDAGQLDAAIEQYEEGLRRDVGNSRLELRLADARRQE